MTDDRKAVLEKLSRDLADKGKLIEAGWITLQIAAVDPSASQAQLDEMRMAFFAGAQHLFASMLTVMEPGIDPTEIDLRRMTLIDVELRNFIAEMATRLLPKKGSA